MNALFAAVARPDGTVGIVSERDLVRALADGANVDEVWAADVMPDDLVLAESDQSIADVAYDMIVEGVRHVAVIERDTIVCVVSARDVLPVLADYARATL